jgi:hypothetical protein
MIRRYQVGGLILQFEEGHQPERAVLIDEPAPAAPAPRRGGRRVSAKKAEPDAEE